MGSIISNLKYDSRGEIRRLDRRIAKIEEDYNHIKSYIIQQIII